MATTITHRFSDLQVSVTANLEYEINDSEIEIDTVDNLIYSITARCGTYTYTESYASPSMAQDEYGVVSAGTDLEQWLIEIIENLDDIVISRRQPVANTLAAIDANRTGYYVWLATVAEMIAVNEASMAADFVAAIGATSRFTISAVEVPTLSETGEAVKPVIDNGENASGISL